MECKPLEVTLISAKDLNDVDLFGKMDVYVVVSLSGDERDKNKQRTSVHKGSGTSPRWGHIVVLTMDEAVARAGCLTLELEIKAERALGRDKDVGRADVPVRELLEQGGAAADDGRPKVMSYSVRLPFGQTKGVLEFSYEFGEPFTVAAPPAAVKKAHEPVAAYPAAAAAAPPASSSAVAYPPPVQAGGAIPSAGGISARLGLVYPAEIRVCSLPPAYHKPPKKSGRGGGGTLFDGLLISDGLEAAYDAGEEFDI